MNNLIRNRLPRKVKKQLKKSFGVNAYKVWKDYRPYKLYNVILRLKWNYSANASTIVEDQSRWNRTILDRIHQITRSLQVCFIGEKGTSSLKNRVYVPAGSIHIFEDLPNFSYYIGNGESIIGEFGDYQVCIDNSLGSEIIVYDPFYEASGIVHIDGLGKTK